MGDVKVDNNRVADFLFEVGMLARTPRSGFHFLLTGKQDVAQHTNRVCFIALTLADGFPEVDMAKLLLMALFHDSTETRISDLNYVHQQYVVRNETKALADQLVGLPQEALITGLMDEYKKHESLEAQLVKDADNIELLLALKELGPTSTQVVDWTRKILPRLKTEVGRALAKAIVKANPSNWWNSNVDKDWWINRDKNKL